jgi:hypothetical protein
MAGGTSVSRRLIGWWTPFSHEEAKKIHFDQVLKRVQEGFIHSRSFDFNEGRFVYRELTGFKLEKAAGHSIG